MTTSGNRQGFLDTTSNRALAFGSAISTLMSYQGLKLVFVSGELSWLSHLSAAAVAGVTGYMIYALWRAAYRAIGNARRGLPMALGMCITMAFTPGILGISSIFNVAGMAGHDAVEHHLNGGLIELETALDARYVAARSTDRFQAALALAASDYTADAASECGTGGRTGAGGDGTVCRTLTAIAERLTRLANESLPKQQTQLTALAGEARTVLDQMRSTAAGTAPMDRKLAEIARLADRFRSTLSELEGMDLTATIRATLQSLPAEATKRPLSAKSKAGKARQQATLDALEEELAAFASQFETGLTNTATPSLSPMPSLDPIKPVPAVMTYWDQYIPYWIMGIALDLMPLVFLLYLCAYRSARTEEEIFVEEALDQSVRSYLVGKTGEDILRGQGTDAKEVRKALGYATGKTESMAEKKEASDE